MTRAERQTQYRRDQRRPALPTDEQIAARRRARFEKAEKRRRFKQKLAAVAIAATLVLGGIGFANHAAADTPKAEPQRIFHATEYADYTNTVLEGEQSSQAATAEHISQAAVKSMDAGDTSKSGELSEKEKRTKEATDYIAKYEEENGARSMDFGEFAPNVDRVYDYFENTGEFTDVQICGILGNIAQESEFNPLAANGPYSIGLFQHEATRKDELMSQPNWKTVGGQLDFVMHEFHTTESNAYNILTSKNTIIGATNSVCEDFERPGQPELATRDYHACQFYLQFNADETNHTV